MQVKTLWAYTPVTGSDRSALKKLDRLVEKMGDVLIKSIKDTKYDAETYNGIIEDESGIARVVIFEKRKKRK
ncbi:MAG: hypothetical protein Q7K26_04860 [bacterium]|nr:hypothetical protein [bacterium]